jgi:hypothetical protein
MIADKRKDLAAAARGLPLKPHEILNNRQALRTSVDDIAKLDENGLPAGPFPLAVDKVRGPGNGQESIVIAMKVADRYNARLRRRGSNSCRAKQQTGG